MIEKLGPDRDTSLFEVAKQDSQPDFGSSQQELSLIGIIGTKNESNSRMREVGKMATS